MCQDSGLDKLFFGDFKYNDNLENILIKCSVLNDFYSTNIFKIYSVATQMLTLNIDERLANSDPTHVDDIAKGMKIKQSKINCDIIDIINKKMDKIEKKYPVEKAKGVSTKYNKLQ